MDPGFGVDRLYLEAMCNVQVYSLVPNSLNSMLYLHEIRLNCQCLVKQSAVNIDPYLRL